ncbi:amidohydrolase [Calorimonas adulescens]|uniref:Amidohydrolase n=1 Tax=Calorimonas adulescens TaxID=2606906 RepID=A0A5D8Q803_9THEO|nr:amidohydrolase [Calorimonas adulescens]
MVCVFDVKRECEELFDEVVAIRRDFHKHPELGFQEVRTAGIVAEKLREYGLEVKTGINKTGVVGLLRGAQPGKTVLLRADMDALKVNEENECDYKSEIEGVMHACGHDAHTAMLLVAAKVLSRHRDEIKGNIKFLFQPSEENFPGGALGMIEEGVLEDPHVDAVFGQHVWAGIPSGKIGVRPGPIMAAPDEFRLTIKGKGGHGSAPHLGVDALVIGAQVVLALQTLVSREIDPLNPAVVSIGTFNSGTVMNAIPSETKMTGTVRLTDPELRKEMPDKIERIVKGVCDAMRGEYSLEYVHGYPPTVNDPEMTELAGEALREAFGEENIVDPGISMGGEDFSYFLEKVPGSFIMLGITNEEKGIDKNNHHPKFDIDENALPLGVEALVRIALKFLNS